MRSRRDLFRQWLGWALLGGPLLAFLRAPRLWADEAPEEPAEPLQPSDASPGDPAGPVAKDFLLPMKVWQRDGWRFGATWKHARCAKCRKHYRHVGEDVNHGRRFARYRVYATEAGIVRQAFEDGRWAWCVVLEHTLAGGEKITSVCWHLSKPYVEVGQVVKRRQVIGVLADLGRGTHLHFGIRRAPFHRVRSCKGALPPCRHSQARLPMYPEEFTDPCEWVREH